MWTGWCLGAGGSHDARPHEAGLPPVQGGYPAVGKAIRGPPLTYNTGATMLTTAADKNQTLARFNCNTEESFSEFQKSSLREGTSHRQGHVSASPTLRSHCTAASS